MGDGVGDRANEQKRGRSAAERTTLAVSAAVISALIGAALFEHYLVDEPPGIRVSVSLAAAAAERRDDVYYVPFDVANRGGEPAANVTIIFEVRRGGELLEQSDATVPFLPVGGSVSGELATRLDPTGHDLAARVGTLQNP